LQAVRAEDKNLTAHLQYNRLKAFLNLVPMLEVNQQKKPRTLENTFRYQDVFNVNCHFSQQVACACANNGKLFEVLAKVAAGVLCSFVA